MLFATMSEAACVAILAGFVTSLVAALEDG